MRTLILFGAFALLATPAFAQNNDADVDQKGNANEATVTQTGTQHEADIDQNSSLVEASVTQTGTSQYAKVEQSGGSPRAFAEVIQGDGSGSGDNSATITQQRSQNDSKALIQQDGTENVGNIFQDTGGFNDAQIYQGQTDDSSSDNLADIDQDRENSGPFLTLAQVYQDGVSNEAYVDQSLSANAFAMIDQDGTDNWADVDQSNSAVDPNHSASITQSGDLNEAQILQEGSAGVQNIAVVLQDGDSNDAFVDQDGAGGSHDMNIFQDGIGNKAGIMGAALFQSGSNQFLDVDQLGDGNIATSIQTGADHEATILQTGGQNEANIQQGN